MITIEKGEISGVKAAVRGMRNPMNSWDLSDSVFYEYTGPDSKNYILGEKDLDLMKRLVKAGPDHRKFLRMIHVTMDITAPLYWWKEFDTYKVGTVANSCSTMHKIHAKEFDIGDFSTEHLTPRSLSLLDSLIAHLNIHRDEFNTLKSKDDWWQMIQLLPSSYNQKRTVSMNYEVLLHIYLSRFGHKLDEWNIFCQWIEDLPYFKDILAAVKADIVEPIEKR